MTVAMGVAAAHQFAPYGHHSLPSMGGHHSAASAALANHSASLASAAVAAAVAKEQVF